VLQAVQPEGTRTPFVSSNYTLEQHDEEAMEKEEADMLEEERKDAEAEERGD
jgi:hypothetical protein